MSEQVTIVVSADEGEFILDALAEMIDRNPDDKHWMDVYQKVGPQAIPDPARSTATADTSGLGLEAAAAPGDALDEIAESRAAFLRKREQWRRIESLLEPGSKERFRAAVVVSSCTSAIWSIDKLTAEQAMTAARADAERGAR